MQMVGQSIATIADGQTAGAEINPKIVKWFMGRKIREETLKITRVYSGKHLSNGSSFRVEPSPEGEVIVFPFVFNGKIVNEKYRAAQKKFYQSGGQKVFWNADILSHPDLQSGKFNLIITEGELDALSFIEAGYPFAVSVPNGAPPPRDGDFQISEDDTAFSYIRTSWDLLKPLKRIILAADADAPGKRLKRELALRLGEARCLEVSYPAGCKDANDVLQQFGVEATLRLITESTPYPISGLYQVTNLPPEPPLEPLSTGWGRLDEFLMVYRPALMVITGIANSGKSTWANQLAAQLAINHGWNIAIASFEMMVRPFITDALTSVYREQVRGGNPDQWLFDHFSFIIPKADDDDVTGFDIDWLIERATAASVRFGIKALIIDPWNQIDHCFAKGESHTEYVNRAIRALKRFGREHGILIIIVAHPKKEAAERKKPEEITLYDISDSQHFSNAADLGVVIARLPGSFETNVFVTKVRYQPITGKPGMINLTFSQYHGTFSQ